MPYAIDPVTEDPQVLKSFAEWRQQWLPAGLSTSLTPQKPIVAANMLGEGLLLFRQNNGEAALVSRTCPHAYADLVTWNCNLYH
jgi:phenylpropionate dioxygenase-like ring-hydroxylating dioxygenase large terminal subunit